MEEGRAPHGGAGKRTAAARNLAPAAVPRQRIGASAIRM